MAKIGERIVYIGKIECRIINEADYKNAFGNENSCIKILPGKILTSPFL